VRHRKKRVGWGRLQVLIQSGRLTGTSGFRKTIRRLLLLSFILSFVASPSDLKGQELTVAGTLTAACAQKIRVSIGESVGNVTFLWEINRGTEQNPDWQPFSRTDLSESEDFFEDDNELRGIDPGSYRVTVTDEGGNTVSNIPLTLTEPYDLRAEIDFAGLICQGDANSGMALINFTNGPPPMDWTLTGQNINLQGQESGTKLVIQDLEVGSYTLDWVSGDDCTGQMTFNIVVPSEVIGVANVIDNVSCPGGNDGQVKFSFSGGWEENEDTKIYFTEIVRDGVLVQNWAPQSTADGFFSRTNLQAGSYTVNYTDRVNEELIIQNFLLSPLTNYVFETKRFDCIKQLSFTITEPDPFELNLISTVAVCQGATNGEIAITPSGGTPTYEINFYEGHFDDLSNPVFDSNDMTILAGSPITNVSAGQKVKKTDLAAGDYAVWLEDANGCLKAENLTIIENPLGQVDAINNITACSGDVITQAFTTSETNGTTRYEWTNSNPAIGLAASGDGDISFTGTNTTNAHIAATITVTPFYSNYDVECEGPTESFEIVVNPEPVGIASFVTVCSDENFNVNPQDNIDDTANGGNGVSSSFSWVVTNITGTVSGVELNDAGTGNIIGTASNTSNTVAVIEYTVTPTANTTGCAGDAFTVTVTVDPEPVGVSKTEDVCSDVPFSFDPQDNINDTGNGGNGVASTFAWEVTDITGSVTGATIGDSNTGNITGTLTNTSSTVGTVEYTITPTSDPEGCEGEPFTITVTVNPEPVVSDQTVGPVCSDQALGEPFNSSSSVAAATYNITNIDLNGLTVSAGNAAVANGLTAADLADDAFTNTTNTPQDVTYTVVPVTAGGCEGQPFTITVTVKDPIVISGDPTDYKGFGISCFGANDGEIRPTISGGKLSTDDPAYVYNWTGPNGYTANTKDIDNLAPGTYTLTVGDGVNICQQTRSFEITEPDPIVVNGDLSDYKGTNISCAGEEDGSIDLIVTGGTGAGTYVYSWIARNGGVIPTGQENAAQLAGIPAGEYEVTVTDLNNCTPVVETYVLDEPDPINLLEVDDTRVNVLCYGEPTGSITVTASGGTPGYIYALRGLTYAGDSVNTQTAVVPNNLHTYDQLLAGNYSLSVVDLNGCEMVLPDITITQPGAPLQTQNIVLSDYSGFNVSCFGDTNGSIDLEVLGGVAPYQYAWTGPNGFTSSSLNLQNLAAGDYELTITDSNNCTYIENIEITTPEEIILDVTPQNVLCGGANDGNIFINNITGGTGTYQFVWIKDGEGEIKRSFTPEDLRDIGPGNYVLIVTDENNCSKVLSYEISEPEPLLVDVAEKTDNLCFGDSNGSININVSGGRGPYTYAWTGPEGFTSSNKNLNGLLSGDYQLVVTDALLCSTPLEVSIDQPEEILINPDLTRVTCHGGNDGAISLSVVGGIPPYTYQWVGPDGFGSTNKNLSNLFAGTYKLLIRDGIGCEFSSEFEIVEPEPVRIEATVSSYNGFEISCKGGSDGFIDLTISGGNGDYQIFWEGPNGFRSNLNRIENLSEGLYEVLVIDDKNCSERTSFELKAPQDLVIDRNDVLINDVSCFDGRDGSISVNIKQASVAPYVYELSGQTISGIPYFEQRSSDDLTLTFDNLRSGNYALFVSDANGCSLSELSDLEVSQPDLALDADVESTDNNCYQSNDGTILVKPNGGTAPYTIVWNNLSQSFNMSNLAPGLYTGIIKDANGCEFTVAAEILEAPIFEVREEVKDISCFGERDGSIKLEIIGGVAPLSIRWDHGPQEPELFNLGPGVYRAVITDDEGCQIIKEMVINEPQPLDLSSQVQDALDCDDPNSGAINIQPFGGTAPYTFAWSNESTEQNLSGIGPGTYSLIMTDVNGCSVVRQFTVIRPPALEVSVVQSSERICDPRGLKSRFEVTVTGGIAPYSLTWNRGNVQNQGLVMETEELGVFVLTVEDGRGCVITSSYQVIEEDPLIPDFDFKSASFDFSFENLVNFDVIFTNLSEGLYKEIVWDFGDGNQSMDWEPVHQYAKAGEYEITLRLRDLDDCVVQTTKKIKITDFFFQIPNVFTPNADGVNDFYFPKFIHLSEIEFWVMNKWGELIYYSNDLDSLGWDGELNGWEAPIGNYVYKVRYKTLDGREFTDTATFLLAR